MEHLIRRIGISSLFIFLPFTAFAAPGTFKEGIELMITWVQGAFTLLFGIMWVGLAWGIVLYLSNSEDEKKLAEIKGYLFWGVIGVTVVFAIWGIIGVLHESIFGGGWGIPLISPPAGA